MLKTQVAVSLCIPQESATAINYNKIEGTFRPSPLFHLQAGNHTNAHTHISTGASKQHARASNNEKPNLQSTNHKLQLLLTLSHNNIIVDPKPVRCEGFLFLFALGAWLQHHLRPESNHQIGNMLGPCRMVSNTYVNIYIYTYYVCIMFIAKNAIST